MHELDMKDVQYVRVSRIIWNVFLMMGRYHEYDFHTETKGMKSVMMLPVSCFSDAFVQHLSIQIRKHL
jgi:hypothetical protein